MLKRLEQSRNSGNRGAEARRAIEGCLVAALLLFAQLSGGSAAAATIETLATPFTGDDSTVRVLLDDAPDSGQIQVTLEVVEGVADIRGVFFDLDIDDLLLSGLSAIESPYVTSFDYASVINLGHGSNLNGGGSPCPCDFGVELGGPGIGKNKDDIQFVTFVLDHDSVDLDLSMFFEQNVGVRVTSVGYEGDSREGSAKLSGMFPIPEPSTGLLLGLGLGALALRARRSR